MTADGPELLALALSLEADGADEDDAVAALVRTAHGSTTTLMGACVYALSLARGLPYDTADERTLELLTRAAQQAVRMSGPVPSGDRATLLQQIVEISGRAAVGRQAVASRSAELDADLDKLRATCGNEAPAAS